MKMNHVLQRGAARLHKGDLETLEIFIGARDQNKQAPHEHKSYPPDDFE
jgi:hypothetical protein